MCRVASGLDSQVLGEQEIFGQFKKAVQSFTNIKTLHGRLQQITDEVISISKAARTETNIGAVSYTHLTLPTSVTVLFWVVGV